MHQKIKVWMIRGIAAGAVATASGCVKAEQEAGAPANQTADTLRDCAELGNPACQAALGGMFESGQGVPPDFHRAFELMLQAARSGYLPAQRSVGVSYILGRGVAKDEEKAAYWLGKASDRGDDEAILLYYQLVEREESTLGC